MARIVIDARESGTSTGRYVDKLVQYLHKLNSDYDITVLTKTPRISYMQKIAPKFKIVESNYKEFTFAEQLGFLGQIRKLKPDLMHFTAAQQPILYRGRTVTTIHDLTTTRFRNPAKNWLVFKSKQQVYKWLIGRVARKSVMVIAPSEFTKRDVAQFSGISNSKIVVTYEAADKITEPAKPFAGLETELFIMYVGRPQPNKNLQRLVEAFALLKPTHPNLKLVLVGKKDVLYERLERWVNKRQIRDVVFTDFVSEGVLRWLYESTAAYVFPSLSEGFGLPPLEAMLHGAPVVSSSATCLPEINGRAAEYFDPLSIKGMVSAIVKVIDNKTYTDRLRKLGHEQAVKYSWRRMAEQTLEVYKVALKS